MHSNKTFDRDIDIVWWDTHPDGFIDKMYGVTWKAFSKHKPFELKNLGNKRGLSVPINLGISDQKRVCFKNVMMPLLARQRNGLFYNSYLVNIASSLPVLWLLLQAQGCSGSTLFRSFSQFILHRLGIKPAKADLEKVRIVILSRSTAFRKILNIKEVSLIRLCSLYRLVINKWNVAKDLFWVTVPRSTQLFLDPPVWTPIEALSVSSSLWSLIWRSSIGTKIFWKWHIHFVVHLAVSPGARALVHSENSHWRLHPKERVGCAASRGSARTQSLKVCSCADWSSWNSQWIGAKSIWHMYIAIRVLVTIRLSWAPTVSRYFSSSLISSAVQKNSPVHSMNDVAAAIRLATYRRFKSKFRRRELTSHPLVGWHRMKVNTTRQLHNIRMQRSMVHGNGPS